MCGIIGAYAFDGFEKKSEEKLRTEASIFITTQLLQMTVDLGKDATGISLLWADGNYAGLKMGIPSPDFIARFGDEETEFKGMMKIWREYPKLCKVFMGHCRKASKGNSYDNKNNHPLQVSDMVFVHNGTLTNDDIIFEKLKAKRSADVDSEAIGHLLKHYTKNGSEPFTKEVIDETTKRLRGTYSVIASSGNNPFQVAQFRDGRPAESVFVKPLKTVFVASNKKYLENVLFEYNKFTQLFSSLDFPYLKEKDVEFKTMIDDSYLIWDLTTPITEETTIEDLYDWAKTPVRADKIWNGITTTTTYNVNNTYNTSKKTVAASSVGSNKTHSGQGNNNKAGKTTTTTDNTDISANNGVLWSRKLNRFKTQSGIEKTREMGAVEVNAETGEVKIIGAEVAADDKVLDEVDKEQIETILCGAANVQEVTNMRNEEATTAVKKNSTLSDEAAEEEVVADIVIEVDMTTDSPEAIKAGEEYCKNLAKFSTDESVVDALDLEDMSVLKALPLFALANRIVKLSFKKGFIAGYDKANVKGPFTKEGEKLNKAETKIRTMKMLLNIMDQALFDQTDNTCDTKDAFLDALADMIKPDALKRLRLDEILTVGDLKNMPMVDLLNKTIQKEQSK